MSDSTSKNNPNDRNEMIDNPVTPKKPSALRNMDLLIYFVEVSNTL